MPALSSVSRPEIVDAKVDYGGEQINVRFDRSLMTLRWLGTVQRAIDAGEAEVVGASFASMITWWDITNDDGTSFPPTADNVAVLPSRLMGEIISAMRTASEPSRAEGNASSGHTSMPPPGSEAPPLTHPNGAVTSPSPEPSASQFQT